MKYLHKLVEFFKSISHFEHKMEVGDINQSSSNLQTQTTIEIPYFNLKMNIYHAFKLLSKYYTFTADYDNFVILIYDSDKLLILESILIIFKGGEKIIQDVIVDPIPEDFNIEGEDSNVFHSVNDFIQKKYSVQIGRIKVIEARVIESIIEASQDPNEKDKIRGSFLRVIDIFLEGSSQNKVKIYPEMPLVIALKRLGSIFPNISSFLSEFIGYFENHKVPVTFFDEEWYITFLRHNNNVSVQNMYEFGKISIKDHFQWKNFVQEFNTQYSKKFHAKPSYFIDINWCIDFLMDVCESEFPLTKGRFEYLLQRFLYFISQNEELWDIVPRPIIYNGYIRLLIRIFGGFHINPRKLSYWSIPTNLTQFLRTNYGPNDQIIFLFTENEKPSRALKIKVEKGGIAEIVHLTPDDLDISQNTDEELYEQTISQFGFSKSIIFLEKSIFAKFLKYIVIDRNSKSLLKLFSGLALLGKLNKKNTFRCYPELPWYSSFKKMGSIQTFRKLNRLLYDFLEF